MNERLFPRTVLTLLLCMLSVRAMSASEPLTLKRCIERGRKEGPNAKIARNQFRSRTFNYRSFNAGLLPQFSINGNIPNYQRAINPVVQPDGTTLYVAQAQSMSSLSLSVSQPIVLTGGSIFVRSSLARTDLLGAGSSTFWQSSPVVVGFSQPLFQLNTYSWDNEANNLQYQSAIKKYNEDMEDAAIDITQKFFDVYVAQMRVDNAALNVSINDTLLTISRGRFEVGKIDENDLLQSELALANAKVSRSSAELDYTIALRALALAIAMPENEISGIVPPEEMPKVRVETSNAIAEAHKNRSDLLDLRLQELNSERNLKNTELSNGFNATVTASFGYNQTANTAGDVYKSPLNQQAASLTFSMPLFQWGRASNAIDAAREDLERTRVSKDMQEQSFDHDVESQVERFLQNQKQLDLSAKADTIAQKQYILATNRYLIGKYDVTKLLLSQDAKDKARESYILAEQNFWLSYFRLRRATLYDFENNSEIDYPIDI